MRRLRLGLVLPAVLLCAFSVAPAANAGVTIGIADQKTDFLHDERFTELGIRHARISVPYDVLQDTDTLPAVDQWLLDAKADGISPLVTFDRSRRPGRKSVTPSPAELARSLRGFRKRWPFIREFSTWNEGNINKNAKIVAKQWLALRKACPSCTILGVDLVDHKNIARWAQDFVRAAGRTPKYWGLHNYVDVNQFTTKETKKLLRAVKGEFWLTETGGVVERRNKSSVRFAGTGAQHAAKATAFLFDKLAKVSKRIRRVYLYHWNSHPDALSWDSGFIGPDGSIRPALDVLKARLKARR
ncbi:hypothetical protein [Conexibacter sp. SYSU D00693]|uniref:hypothetical protein n=1 Tax=Conexibacter sp. SYSU D00693 TaxID=2812560 RepID=UPI00196BA6A9|nr:hypothetical protein [Conexibacter sp. SYSU D00693]